MKKLITASSVALTTALLSFAAYGAAPPPATNWGQTVKDCNATSCYPGRHHAWCLRPRSGNGDSDDWPGYGYEIQTLAPIPSNPPPFRSPK